MAKLEVYVTFDSGSKKFTFDPPNVEERDKGGGTVVLYRRPDNTGWHFTDARIKNDDGSIKPKVGDAGATITFHNKNSRQGTYQYYVVIQDKTGPHTSPDPQIINSGPDRMAFEKLYPLVGAAVGAIVGALIDRYTGDLTTRSPFKGLVVGAVIGAIVGWLLARRGKP